MSVQKNFVVKNGIEVNNNLIFADANSGKVGIATTNPQYTLDVVGGIGGTSINISGLGSFGSLRTNLLQANEAYISAGVVTASRVVSTATSAQNLNVTGVTTLSNTSINNLTIGGHISAGNTTGKNGQLLISTGTGVTWSTLKKNSALFVAEQNQTSFDFNYEPGTTEVYVNGVRLSPAEYVATNGTQVVLNTSCFGGETVEILANQLPFTEDKFLTIGLTVQDEGNTVGTAASISLVNFVGAGVTVTSAGAFGVNVNIDNIVSPPGKTIYVAMNGNDSNNGLTLDYAKRTIKAAVGIASGGDTVKVLPGTYVEINPIVLGENVSIEGAELRNCIVIPTYPDEDLFHVSNGDHITDLSFQGQPASNGAAVVAFKPLVGVASDRFFDAARIIRYNLDFIASEAVGYLTSTDYRSPAFTLSGGDYTSCKDDIKDIFRAVCHDITRGGNSKCVGAGLSYYNGSTLQHIVGVKTETIDTIKYAAGIAVSCINNVLWTGNYQNEFTQLRDLSIQADSFTGSNTSIDSCANVVSAIHSCVGVVTTIIGVGTTAIGTLFNRTYPGNAGIGTTNPNDIPSQGVGNVTKGPYIRNCTNFIANSIGMKVDGFHADPGDKDDMGITGMMSVDSYTQYNQGGIGVEISNGAYAQLVSIFTICDDKGIVTKSGGQCDITNSNSSFGTYGLVSDGVGDASSKCIYHYTGNVSVAGSEGDITFVIEQIGRERPYSGQVLYFGELFYDIESVTIQNPGEGYTDAPTVVFTTEFDPSEGNPSGPSGIKADATATISDGRVVSVDMIGNGRNYRLSDLAGVTFTGGGSPSVEATAVVNLRPLYYQVRAATLPAAGISTVTLAQPLNNNVGVGTTVFLSRQSLQIVSSHSFQYIGAGNTIELARPSEGGVTVQANEVVKLGGGEIVYTSTDQDGNFAIGDDLIIDQATGTIRGRSFERSLLNTVTPFIIALGAK